MVRDFIIVMDGCAFCPEIKMAKVLSQANIDLIDIHSGDLRVAAMERQYGKMVRSHIPIGMVNGHLINHTRDAQWMMKFFEFRR